MKQLYKRPHSFSTIALLSMFVMAGCTTSTDFYGNEVPAKATMYEPTKVTERPITLEKGYFVDKKPSKEVDYAYLGTIVDSYERNGDSPIYALFVYDPNKDGAKLAAFNRSNVVKGQLSKLGAKDIVVKTMPVRNSADLTVIGYDNLTARGPKPCYPVPGVDPSENIEKDYLMGCHLKDVRARSVAYTKDLEGQDAMSAYNAGRASAVVTRDPYSGQISNFVPNYIISSVGG